MLWCLVVGLLLGALLMLIPLRRAQNETDAAVAENQKLAQDRERLIEFMHHMTAALGEGLGRQDLHQRIVHASILCTGALSACIFEETPRQTMRAVAVEGLFPPHRPLGPVADGRLVTRAKYIEQVLKAEEFPISEGVVGRVARSRRGELIADAMSDPQMVKHEDPALAVRSVIVVPLAFRDRFFGVLAVTNPAGDVRFTEGDFTLLRSLAEQAALALHNADLLHLQIEKKQLDLDLSLASGIQQMLLPRENPTFPGLEIDARYRPSQRVGGDLYDVIPLDGSRLGIAVADVSGKGIPASLLMAICRTALRQIAPRYASPAPVLVDLNRTLAGQIESGLYVTMIYAIVDVPANRVTLARAGHELPLLVRGDARRGSVQPTFVDSEGMGLGLVPDELFSVAISEVVEPFAAGDALVLYTDGVTEAPNAAGREFSSARLTDAVRAAFAGSPREINDAVLAAVHRFGGELAQRDDFTLVTIKRS